MEVVPIGMKERRRLGRRWRGVGNEAQGDVMAKGGKGNERG